MDLFRNFLLATLTALTLSFDSHSSENSHDDSKPRAMGYFTSTSQWIETEIALVSLLRPLTDFDIGTEPAGPGSRPDLQRICKPKAITVDLQLVSDTDNRSNGALEGAVDYEFYIGTYEITNAQYASFLNAVAQVSDPKMLYHPTMSIPPYGGIDRFTYYDRKCYVPKQDMEDKPVTNVTWGNAARFSNWLNHQQPTGNEDQNTTETGAYNFTSNGDENLVYYQGERAESAHWALPSQDEWVKSSTYDPSDPSKRHYWTYATGTNDEPQSCSANDKGQLINPLENTVNYNCDANWNFSTPNGNLSTVGSAGPLNKSTYGTFDQFGNAFEWTEQIVYIGSLHGRGVRGGSFEALKSGVDSDGMPILNGLLLNYAPLWAPDTPYISGAIFRRYDVGFRVTYKP